MKSRTTTQFRKQLAALPEEIRKKARLAYRRFQLDPSHGSLRFKSVHPSQPIDSVRITRDYRALGKRGEKGMLWFWIGSHADYNHLLKRQ